MVMDRLSIAMFHSMNSAPFIKSLVDFSPNVTFVVTAKKSSVICSFICYIQIILLAVIGNIFLILPGHCLVFN